MGVALGDQPLKSLESDTCLAPRSRSTKLTLTVGEAGGYGASATTAAFPGDGVGSHWTGSLAGRAAGAAEA
jgi:hypothetical protein